MKLVLEQYPDADSLTIDTNQNACYADFNIQGIGANNDQDAYVMCLIPKETQEETQEETLEGTLEEHTCLSGFEKTPDVHSLGGVCHDVDVVDLEACLCACQEDETCKAVDWNKSENPHKGCRCWLLSGENELAPITNARVDRWTKQPDDNPETAAEEAGPDCDIIHGVGRSSGTYRPRETVGEPGQVASAEECASLVFTQKPDATSMTYFGHEKTCKADFETDHIYDHYGKEFGEFSCMNPELFPEQRGEFYTYYY